MRLLSLAALLPAGIVAAQPRPEPRPPSAATQTPGAPAKPGWSASLEAYGYNLDGESPFGIVAFAVDF